MHLKLSLNLLHNGRCPWAADTLSYSPRIEEMGTRGSCTLESDKTQVQLEILSLMIS